MLDLSLEKFDFVGGQVVDAVVEFGLGIGQLTRQTFDFGFLLRQIRLPLVRHARTVTARTTPEHSGKVRTEQV